MSIEAMKQALEALRCIESPRHVWEINKLAGAMNALRQAIEQAEKQEPVGYLYDWLNPKNRDEVIRDWFAASMYVIEKDKGFNVRPLYTAPVTCQENRQVAKSATTEWVGLTDEEVGGLTVVDGLHDVEVPILADLIRDVEAKLKEKNA